MKDDGNHLPNLRVFEVVGYLQFGLSGIRFGVYHRRHPPCAAHQQMETRSSWRRSKCLWTILPNIKSKGEEVYEQTSSTLDTQTIAEKFYYIFEWLQLFDFNIIVILIVMIVVATINMIVALLVLILERTQMIGILKALGASNWSVRKIFLYNAFYLIVRGLFWGNAIGIGLVLIQQYFGVVKLNPESYYVNVAPVHLDWLYILMLNVGTAFVCLLVLLVPSYIITKISPVKAIRYE